MAFRAKFPDALVFKHIVETVADFGDANWTLDTDGIFFSMIDGSHVALVEVSIPADALSEYEVERPVELGVSMKVLLDALKGVSPTSKTTLVLQSVNNHKRRKNVAAGTGADDKYALDFGGDMTVFVELNQLELDQDVVSPTAFDPHVQIIMPCTMYKRLCTANLGMGDQVSISCGTDELKAMDLSEASDDDNDDEEDAAFSAAEDVSVSFSTTGANGTITSIIRTDSATHVVATSNVIDISLTTEYALKYLSRFACADTLAKLVTISLIEDMPIFLRFDITKLEGAYVRFCLAPKIPDEDADDD